MSDFAVGQTVRVMYRALRRRGFSGWPDRATVVALEHGDSLRYLVRPENSDRIVGISEQDVFATCGCARPSGCTALIHHGPGHQSHTHCRRKDYHEVHEAVYGSERQFAEWRGDVVFSGFFDEPPEEA